MSDALSTALLLGLGLLTGGVAGGMAGRALRRRPKEQGPTAQETAERMRVEARAAAEAAVREAEIAAREQALAARAEAEAEAHNYQERQARLGTTLVHRQAELEARARDVQSAAARLAEREAPVVAREQERGQHQRAVAEALAQVRAWLEKASGQRAADLCRSLAEVEVETARAAAAQLVRHAAELGTDAELGRRAKRVMGIAVGRFSGHYLTERHHSVVPLPVRNGRAPGGRRESWGRSAPLAGVKLTLNEAQDAVRIEGLDGVGREVARRCLSRLLRHPVGRGRDRAGAGGAGGGGGAGPGGDGAGRYGRFRCWRSRAPTRTSCGWWAA